MSAQKPTLAELETAEVHDARALVRGDDECTCRLCQRVAAWRAAEKCAIADHPSAMEIVQLALDDEHEALAARGYLAVNEAYSRLLACVYRGCPRHGRERPTLSMLDQLVLELAMGDEVQSGAP